tara:strand:- start:315 stop:623 length:309 start_codon:yes stop_codon:yes gene_type:complete
MVKRAHKQADGKYHIKGKKYVLNVGGRAQVMHGTAYKTPGGLTKKHLMMNKHGRVVSRKKHATAKRENRLAKAGFKPKKGTFKAFKKSDSTLKKKRGTRRRR